MGRRKKKQKEQKEEKPKELGGWTVGDLTWVVPLGDTSPTQIEIMDVYPHDNIEPALSGRCQTSGRTRTVAGSWCADSRAEAKLNFNTRRDG